MAGKKEGSYMGNTVLYMDKSPESKVMMKTSTLLLQTAPCGVH